MSYRETLNELRQRVQNVADEYESDEGVGGDGEPFGPDQEVLDALDLALDNLDTAIDLVVD